MSTDSKLNYYEILQISNNASEKEILVAYEKAKQMYSPHNSTLYNMFTEAEANELRKLTEQAYKILSQSVYRNHYDRHLFSQETKADELEFDQIIKACENVFKEQDSSIVETHKFKKLEKLKYEIIPEFEEKLSNCQQWDGSLLRKTREYKQLSLDKMHELTKVNSWYISAIENMDPTNLPAPVFVRGYVVQLAKTLQLNEKLVADSYMKAYKHKLEPDNNKSK